MRRFTFFCAVVLFLSCVAAADTLAIKPTTTLKAQTSNNTSAADSFARQSNGNAAAGSVSKVDIRTLLYPGARTKVLAHFMPWFGGNNHMNVGYTSADRNQVKRQITDMVSRGIDGVIVDWYGQDNAMDRATQMIMQEAEAHPGFVFAIMVDHGAIRLNGSCLGCTAQQVLVQQLQYVERTYFTSPAYWNIDGRPVITNFDIDLYYTVDWKIAKTALASNPILVFQNNTGFQHTVSNGSYSWVKPTTTDYGMKYLDSFYAMGMSHPTGHTVGATYKGFNDTQASWGLNRIMGQQCGKTWLQTFDKINAVYSSGNQLDYLQLVTWNDYEEGTEIESGIDNCLSISASVSGDSFNWNVKGSESTLDRYRVYISNDGQNLMPLTDMTVGTNSLNLCSFSLAAGNYKLFAQAIGKPSIVNRMSSAVAYSPTCAANNAPVPAPPSDPTPPPSDPTPPSDPGPADVKVAMNASPSNMAIVLGKSGRTTITVTTPASMSGVPITLGCDGLPGGMTCSFSPAVVVAGSKARNSTLTIATVAGNIPILSESHGGKSGNGILMASTFAFSVAGFVVIGEMKRKKLVQVFLVVLMIGVVFLLSSCGGYPTTVKAGSSYSITITGTSSKASVSTMATVDVK